MAFNAECLNVSSVEWAFAHLRRYGDSDILPVPFEYEAMAVRWLPLREYVCGIDLTEHATRPLQHYLFPKTDGGWRVATRLDPIDTLVYTALVHECSTSIEEIRVPKRRGVACAYRIDPRPDGRLFADETGWDLFQERCRVLSGYKKYKYVVTADIADFYSQINHHRVCNVLEQAGVATRRARCMERLLGGWSALQSRGIPVGPQGSIVLAEAVLHDVDDHLMTKGYVHTRYVDDFRVFCTSYRQAREALHDLTKYLFHAHRLALQSAKTFTFKTATFVAKHLENPGFLARQRKTEKMAELVEALKHASGYAVTVDDLSDDSEAAVTRETLRELFGECVAGRPLRLGVARYTLRNAASVRTAELQPLVIANLEILTPVLRDAMIYLMRSRSPHTAKTVAESLIKFAKQSNLSFSPFVWEWVAHVLLSKFARDSPAAIKRCVAGARQYIGYRSEALAARAYANVAWVRQHKETWNSMAAWDRRALIAAGSVLSADERTHWLASVQTAGDPLDQAVADFALRGS